MKQEYKKRQGLNLFFENLDKKHTYHFAYVFERFPSFTQTFCVREVSEMISQGIYPLIFSIRDTSEEKGNFFQYSKSIFEKVIVLPPKDELVAFVKKLKDEKKLPHKAAVTLRLWGNKSDKMRVYEACFIGYYLKKAGVTHMHCHFAGLAARTCWMIRKFYGFSYSFTGHANDIFCEDRGVLSLEDLINGASLVVTVSDYSVKKLIAKVKNNDYKIKRVYNGIDVEPFELIYKKRIKLLNKQKTQRSNENKEKVSVKNKLYNKDGKVSVILSIGRLIEKKGFSDLINACAIIKAKTKHKFRCIIVGEGPLKSALMEQIETLNLSSHVFLLGEAPQQFIMDQLAETDIFALASKIESDGGMDNLPTVIMEAMAAGVPCISTSVAGIPEMIASHVTGLLVKEGDSEQLGKNLIMMLDKLDEAQLMGKYGLIRAKRYFAKEVTCSQLKAYIFSKCRVNFTRDLFKENKFYKYFFINIFNRMINFLGIRKGRCSKKLYVNSKS